jgi:2,4-dienoyl-CoA reductase-like NADH-dependent reductase (Old Yellow Enzyme family)
LTFIQTVKRNMKMFTPCTIGTLNLPNRIIRSGTFEGMADENGFITDEYIQYYDLLSKQKIGAIICGFSYISLEGKAMQPGQVGVDSVDKIPLLKKLTETVHKNGSIIIMQIAHSGRQTLEKATGQKTVSSSSIKSKYFNQKPETLSIAQIETLVEKFGDAADYCKQAGFDGVQLHGAHGYLIHQFITPSINKRKDKYGIDKIKKTGTQFLSEIIENVREKCGDDFPVLIKISSSDDLNPKFTRQQFTNLIRSINGLKVDAIEISYGTMDYALNIFRGDIPVNLILSKNLIFKTENSFKKFIFKTLILPVYKMKLKSFTPHYNLEDAILARTQTQKPLICVGGFRNSKEIEAALGQQINFVSLCRPFICEPDLLIKIETNNNYASKCSNCNYCAIMCDTGFSTKCYKTSTAQYLRPIIKLFRISILQ